MGCITCPSSSAAALRFSSSSFQPSRISSEQECSPSVICPGVSFCSPGRSRLPGRFWHVRRSPSFRNFGSAPLSNSATFFSSATPLVVCTNTLEAQDFPHSPSRVEDEESRSQNMSAKERRKLRNERREAAILAQEQPWREVVEDRLLEKKKKIRTWREDADLNRCTVKGVQWWMLQTTRKFEFDVAEQIEIIFPEMFPEREFQVVVPTVPVKIKLKDGSVSQARKKLYQGIVLLRCLLDRDVYFRIKNIPRAYEFFGTQAGLSVQPIIMPAPVSNFNMEIMFQKIRREEEDYEAFKEQCRMELEEQKKEKRRKIEEQKERKQRMDEEQQRRDAEKDVLAVGSTVRVLSGPFLDFTGVVIELLPENKIKALVTVFGSDTPVVLPIKAVRSTS